MGGSAAGMSWIGTEHAANILPAMGQPPPNKELDLRMSIVPSREILLESHAQGPSGLPELSAWKRKLLPSETPFSGPGEPTP